MQLDSLMLEFAQALGGVSKHRGDFWILEIPQDKENCVVFFRLNSFKTAAGIDRLMVFFTQIGMYSKGTSVESFLQFEYLMKANVDLRYSKVGLMGERIVLLSTAHEDLPEEYILEQLHEVVWAGLKLKQALRDM